MSDIKDYHGGSPKTLNEINMSVVLDRIRRSDTVSRASLAKELNLTFPTISRIVDVLIKKKIIVEVGLGKSSGGKRPTLLKFNSSRAYVIGIGVDIDFIKVIISDLSGNQIKNIYKTFTKYKKPDEMTDMIVSFISKAINESKLENEKIEAVSIGVPAVVDIDTGIIHHCPTIPTWNNINLCKILSEKLKKKVLIENVARLSLLGEVWQGVAQEYKDIILIAIGTGIGAGIMVNGKLLRGINGSAGEIGYIYIDKNMDKGDSYPFGQFEYLSSNTALRRIGFDISFDGISNKVLNEWLDDSTKKEKIITLVDNFAFGIANLISILNPELIVIRGGLFNKSDCLFSYLTNKVITLTPFKVKLVRSSLYEDDITIGAVKHALNYLDSKMFSPFFSYSSIY